MAISEVDLIRLMPTTHINALSYTLDDRERLLQLHQKIAEKHQVADPYFYYTSRFNSRKELLMEVPNYLPGVDLKVGSINAFKALDVAAIVNDQSFIYVLEGALGELALDDNLAMEELLASMIGGFSCDDLLISYQKNDHGQFKPLVGGKVIVNRPPLNNSRKVIEEINGKPDSKIPTFAAVKIDQKTLKNSGLANVYEDQVVGISRFFNQNARVMRELGFTDLSYHRLPLQTIAQFVGAYRKYAILEGFSIPLYAVYDTNLPKLINVTESRFGAKIIASGDQITPTDYIMKTILRYHYGDEFYGGFKGQISVASFTTENYLKGAEKILASYPSL